MRLVMVAVLVAYPLMASAVGSEWFCEVTAAGGVHYDNEAQEWKGTPFGAKRTYLISEVRDEDEFAAYVVTKVGDSSPMTRCNLPPNSDGIMYCGWGEYISAYFNANSMRLQMNFAFDVVNGFEDPEKARADVFIEMARCSPI